MTARAKNLYNKICEFFEGNEWKFKRNDDDLTIHFVVSGHKYPLVFVLMIDSERELIRLTSPLPSKFDEDKIVYGAIATCYVNDTLADGSFDYDISDGSIQFRMTASFKNSRIGEGLFAYMIGCSLFIVDKYSDKYLEINKGTINITDFLCSD